ncbi:MAG: YdeI/OmpD-associated family protein [Acidimicrobiales bacterium]
MAKHRFTATPVAAGKSGAMASVEVPGAVLEALGGKRVPVKVTVNGFTFRTTTAAMKGRTVIGFNTANRKAAGVEAGAPVTVTVERDDEPRTIDPPTELVDAFRTNATAKSTWEALSYSHQREYAEWIEGAKKAETRQRRVAQAVERLAAGAKTFR